MRRKTQEPQDRVVIKRKYLRFEQLEVFRPMPTKTQEQQDRFVDHTWLV